MKASETHGVQTVFRS